MSVRSGSGGEPDAAELAARARALAPLLAEQAAEAERLRHPTDTVIRALEEAGVFRLMVPRAYGGLELDLDAFLEVGLALAEGDASMSWVTTFYVEHNWMLCQFPEAFQREVFAERSWVLAPAMISPTGQARRDGDGFRLSGRWQWATGAMHGTWVIVAAPSEPGNLASMCFFAVPRHDVKVEDTWYVDGMCGTGSNDVVLEDVFVPEGRMTSIAAMVEGRAHGASLHPSPLYRTPMMPILLLAASMPAVGQAKAAVRDFGVRTRERARMGGPKQVEKPAIQMRMAEADLAVRQVELALRDVVAQVMARRADATVEERARWAATISRLVHQCRRVVEDVAEASGGSAHFTKVPLQRMLRDLHVLSCHVIFDRDTQRENYGRVLLGLEPSAPIF